MLFRSRGVFGDRERTRVRAISACRTCCRRCCIRRARGRSEWSRVSDTWISRTTSLTRSFRSPLRSEHADGGHADATKSTSKRSSPSSPPPQTTSSRPSTPSSPTSSPRSARSNPLKVPGTTGTKTTQSSTPPASPPVPPRSLRCRLRSTSTGIRSGWTS